MERYISPRRIAPNDPIQEIVQPRQRVSITPYPAKTSTQIVQPAPPSTTQSKSSPQAGMSSNVALGANWVYTNNWAVIPEHTSMPNLPTIENLAVVVGYSGANAARYNANRLAMARMLHANPRPKYFIFVEFVNPGEVSHYSNLEAEGWDKVIVKNITEKSKNVWQKEAIWTVGGNYAFSLPGITKCVFLDADTAFHDNSWCYYINKELDKYGIIQSFEAFYYADQPDCGVNYYGPKHVRMSTAWALMHGEHTGAPGGSYACTKDFYKNILSSHWPCSSRGSGDAVLWLFLKGIGATYDFPMHFDFRLSDKPGVMSNVNIGYAPLLAIHYNHGPLFGRMHCSRDYLLRKTNTYPGSDLITNEEGVLEWAPTVEGTLMNKATEVLFEANNKAQARGVQLGVADIKRATYPVREEVYGAINDDYPLVVVTYADETVSNEAVINLRDAFKVHCSTSHTFVAFTNREIPGITCHIFNDLTTHNCSSIWHRLAIFNYNYGSNTSVLFVDPKVVLKHNFLMFRCPAKYLYMARPYILAKNFGHCNWDSSVIYFRSIEGLFDRYKSDLEVAGDRHPEYQFIDPADYVNAYIHYNGYTCRNIIAQIDYVYEGQQFYKTNIPIANFVLPDL